MTHVYKGNFNHISCFFMDSSWFYFRVLSTFYFTKYFPYALCKWLKVKSMDLFKTWHSYFPPYISHTFAYRTTSTNPTTLLMGFQFHCFQDEGILMGFQCHCFQGECSCMHMMYIDVLYYISFHHLTTYDYRLRSRGKN